MSTIDVIDLTALFGIFLEINKHPDPRALRWPIGWCDAMRWLHQYARAATAVDMGEWPRACSQLLIIRINS